jgi:hypothetical protein
MRPSLTAEMARVVVEDRVEAAERFRRGKEVSRAAPKHVPGARHRRPRIRERLTMAAGRLSRHTAANPHGGR